MNTLKLKNKNVLVLGLGTSGFAAAQLLAAQGARVEVRDDSHAPAVCERAKYLQAQGIDVQLGGDYRNGVAFDLAVLSPGIAPNVPLVRSVADAGIRIISEIELGFRFCRCPVVAITGTNGKTTTTELVTAILQAGGKRAIAAGNIGYAFCEAVTQSDKLDAMVLEVSSFQLEAIEKFCPQVSVLLNITPDHLDRYESLSNYALAKAEIFRYQTASDFALLSTEAEVQMAMLGVKIRAQRTTFSAYEPKADLWFKDGVIHGQRGYLRGKILAMNETKLRGPHNAENCMAALAVGAVFAIPREAMTQTLRNYQPPPHRMEFVAEIDGVTFINDSKATNVDAVHKALMSLTQPVVLIAGGKDKGFPFGSLKSLLRERVRHAVLIGETRHKLMQTWSDVVPCTEAADLRDAVLRAVSFSRAGDVVLLSPACSSFDMFANYADRGDQFKRLVQDLAISSRASDLRWSVAPMETQEKAPLPFGANR